MEALLIGIAAVIGALVFSVVAVFVAWLVVSLAILGVYMAWAVCRDGCRILQERQQERRQQKEADVAQRVSSPNQFIKTTEKRQIMSVPVTPPTSPARQTEPENTPVQQRALEISQMPPRDRQRAILLLLIRVSQQQRTISEMTGQRDVHAARFDQALGFEEHTREDYTRAHQAPDIRLGAPGLDPRYATSFHREPPTGVHRPAARRPAREDRAQAAGIWERRENERRMRQTEQENTL